MAVLGGGNSGWGGHRDHLPVFPPFNSLQLAPGGRLVCREGAGIAGEAVGCKVSSSPPPPTFPGSLGLAVPTLTSCCGECLAYDLPILLPHTPPHTPGDIGWKEGLHPFHTLQGRTRLVVWWGLALVLSSPPSPSPSISTIPVLLLPKSSPAGSCSQLAVN